jgi:two-component system, cell cycle response regulator DivK
MDRQIRQSLFPLKKTALLSSSPPRLRVKIFSLQIVLPNRCLHSTHKTGAGFSSAAPSAIIKGHHTPSTANCCTHEMDFMPNILLIEDIADNAELVRRVLTPQGYQITWAETAEGGLVEAESHLPELVLLDLGLPDIDGQTLVSYLRDLPGMREVPIIAVTAWPEETAREMVTAYGCNNYISKPIDVRAFIRMVNAYFPARVDADDK